MATYPVNQSGKGARIDVEPDSGIQLTSMSDGTIRGFTDYTEPTFRLTITHFWLEKADVDAIREDFYDADPFSAHTVATELEGTYSARFINRPRVTEKSAGVMNLVSEMIGTKV